MGQAGQGHGKGGWRGRLTPRRLLALVLILIVAGFILQNREEVSLRILLFTISSPLWAVSASLVVLGMLLGWLLLAGRGAGRD